MIKKITLMCVVAMLCVAGNISRAQNFEIIPFKIGERVHDLTFKNIINYKDSAASLSSFGNKLIILDFWDTHCSSCIQMFPLEDSLQAMFPNDVQFILVTGDSKENVSGFLKNYNANQKQALTLPVIVSDKVLSHMFRFSFIPHYVWIAPNGEVLAQSSDYFITGENITNTLIPIRAEEKRLKGSKYADINLKMLKPSEDILRLLSIINH